MVLLDYSAPPRGTYIVAKLLLSGCQAVTSLPKLESKDGTMYHDEVHEYLKTIGTVALSLVLMATAIGMACYHIFG
jgi:hypothetical protein